LDQAERQTLTSLPFLFALRNGASLLGGGRGVGVGLAIAAGIWAQDEEDRNRSGNDAGDDDQQERAAEGLSFLRWRGGGKGHGGWMQDGKFVKFLWRGERVFFWGFLRKHGGWVWFFDGVIVVECVVNVVNKHHPVGCRKIRHILLIYFSFLDSAIG
jgi:hypothetical protein